MDRHTGADWRTKACNANWTTAGGRLRDEIYTTDRGGVAIFTYVCDVSSVGGGHSSFHEITTEASPNVKRPFTMHSIWQIM